MYRVLALFSPDEPAAKSLIGIPGAEFVFKESRSLTEEDVKDADIIFGNPPPRLLASAKKLKWLQIMSAGTDGYTAPGVIPEGVVFTNATGAFGLAIAEHMLGALLFIMKKFGPYADWMKTHTWGDRGSVTSIYGSTTLIIGFGDLGSEFGYRMHLLGSRVLGVRRTVQEKPEWLDGLYTMDAIDALLPEADIVALSVPSTKETYHLIDERRLALMKNTAYLLNSGRGTAIDPKALCKALNEGTIGGAAIDVTEPEPLPADDPLWDAPNLFITPHVSGGRHLNETTVRLYGILEENLKHFLKGEELKNIVDLQTGYRRP